MKYNVKYTDLTGDGFVFNEDVELLSEPATKEELKIKLKQEIVKELKNTTKESKLEIISWTKYE